MKPDLMKLAAIAMALTLAVFGHADDANDTTAQTPEDETHAAQTELEAARAAMDAAREEVAEAAKRLAKLARDQSTLQFSLEGPRRAFLGVMLGEQSTDGIVVAGVTPAGGAETAGIQADDIIVALNGETLTGDRRPVTILHRVLNEVAPGAQVNLVVSRDGEAKSFDIVTSPRAAWSLSPAARVSPAGRAGHRLSTPSILHTQLQRIGQLQPLAGSAGGLQLVDVGEDLGDYFGVDGGVLVLDAPAKSELRPGDILRRIDGADVGSSHEAHRLLAGSAEDEADVEIRRKNRTVSVAVPKTSGWQHRSLLTMPRGKARVRVDGPEVEVDIIHLEADEDA